MGEATEAGHSILLYEGGVSANPRKFRQPKSSPAKIASVFVSERKVPLTTDAIRKILGRAGRHTGLEFPIHPHMLRNATGYELANDGQDTRVFQHYLGHRNIQHTTLYIERASDRFRNFWHDRTSCELTEFSGVWAYTPGQTHLVIKSTFRDPS